MDESPNCCRVCLKGGANVPIFEEENIAVDKKLSICLGEQIQDIPGYPRHICSLCQITLNMVCQFIDQMKESQELILNGWCEGIVRPKDVTEINFPKNEPEKADFQEFIIYPKLVLGKEITEDIIKMEPADLERTDYDGGLDYEIINIKKRASKKQIKLNKENNDKKTLTKLQNQNKVAVPEAHIRKDYPVPNTECFTCSLCSKSFNHKNSLSRHILKAHTPESLQNKLDEATLLGDAVPKVDEDSNTKETFLCPICGKVIEPSKVSHHKLSHGEPDGFHCSLCNWKCKYKTHMRTHKIRIHTPYKDRKYECVECGKKYGIARDLQQHKDRVHLKKKVSYKCDQCSKVFFSKSGLVIHIRSKHTGERPVICTVCGAGFFSVPYLRGHMRLHTGEMPFKCPICGRGHSQYCNMKSHLRVHSLSELTEDQRKTMRPSYLKRLKQ